MNITSEEIARIAGVSRSTVSRVINKYPNVPEKTRQRVLKIVEEYDYRPNEMARALVGKAGSGIGLLLLEQRFGGLIDTGFVHRMIAELVRACHEHQGTLSICLIRDEQDLKDVELMFQQNKIVGGLFCGFEYEVLRLNEMIRKGYNVAALGMRREDYLDCENAVYLDFNNEQAGYMATRYLLDAGKRNILHVAGDDRLSSVLRQQGYERAMTEAGLKDRIRIARGNFKAGIAGEAAVRELADYPADAIYAANDRMAMGVIAMLQRRKIRVPEDILVMGCDFLEDLYNVCGVQIPSIVMHRSEMADTAVKMLLGLQEKGNYTSPLKIVHHGAT